MKWEVLHPKTGHVGNTEDEDEDEEKVPDLVMQPFAHGKTLFAIGGTSTYSGRILRSDDDGATWTPYDFDAMKGKKGTCDDYDKMMGLRRMVAASPTALFACGEYATVLYSTNAGKSWKQYEPPIDDCLFGVLPIGDDLWVSGDHGIHRRPIGDAKADWKTVDETPGLARLYPASNGKAYAVGDKGALLEIAKGKVKRLSSGTTADLGGLVEVSPGRLVIVGKGVALAFDGKACVASSIEPVGFLSEVVKLANGSLFAVGSMEDADEETTPLALVSDDGKTWRTTEPPPGTDALWGACVTAFGRLIVTGGDDLVARAI